LTEPTQYVSVSLVGVTIKQHIGSGEMFPRALAPGLQVAALVTVTDDDFNGFLVEVEVVPDKGRLAARSVSVRQRPDGPPVTGEVIRSVPVAAFVRSAATVVERAEPVGDGVFQMLDAALTEQAADEYRQAGPTDRTLRAVAALYRLAYAVGDAPTKGVEQGLGLPRSTAGRWVAMARERGFLGQAEGPGKAGG